jgi:hypothetical protein
MKYLLKSEAVDIFNTFIDMIDNEIPIEEELQIYEDAINRINPVDIKEFFLKSENKKYYIPVFKAIVKKWEGEQKPSVKLKKKKRVNLIIEDDTPAKMTLKERQQAMKEKLKKLDENVPSPASHVRVTSPNGFGAFETYLLLRIQPNKDNEANNLIKMLERDFIERGFTESAVKDIKKILKLAKYRDLVITSAIQERINNPVVPESVPAIPGVVPQPKKRGRPPKKKILEGSNNLILIDNIIKQSNITTKMLKDYFDYIYEEGSQ